MTHTPIRNPLIDKANDVAERAARLFSDRLSPDVPPFDYISVFTSEEGEFDELVRQAKQLGEVVFEKNGPVYRLDTKPDLNLPTQVIRIGNPHADSALIGTADFVTDDYPGVKSRLVGTAGYNEVQKDGYDIAGIVDPDSRVAIYFASMRLTEELMGISAEKS